MQIFIICPQTCPEKLEIWQAGRETPKGRYYEKIQKLLPDIFYLYFGMFLSPFFGCSFKMYYNKTCDQS
jgi:hypothetical protein